MAKPKDAKTKLIIMSEEMFNAVGRVTFEHNISANAFILLAIQGYMKKNCKVVYKEYKESLKLKK